MSVLTLILPAFLLHGRGIADGLISAVAVLFLLRSALAGAWDWLRTPWVRVGLAWWAWLVLCSVPGLRPASSAAFGNAVATVRFLLFVAALEQVALRAEWARLWLARVLAAASLYIAAQSLLQFATGQNLYGQGRNGDGELTGPFDKPRAAAPLSRLLPPVLLPALDRLLARGDAWRRALAAALALGAIGTVVLIGQRMPLLLTAAGFLLAGLLLRRLRATVLAACVAGAVLVGASAAVSPPTFHRLVLKFSTQMQGFDRSAYGLIAARAVAIAQAHPWMGQGYDGFRDHCPEPQYFHGWPWFAAGDDGGGSLVCNIHPHNFYLQAVTDAGIPGLALFSALVASWLRALGRGVWRYGDPLRVGLFVSAAMQFWPLASTSSLTAIELGGFSFLLLGWGLAEQRLLQRHAEVLAGRRAAEPAALASASPGARTDRERARSAWSERSASFRRRPPFT